KMEAVSDQGVELTTAMVTDICSDLGEYPVAPALYDGYHQTEYYDNGLADTLDDADYIVDQAVLIGCPDLHGQHARYAPAWITGRPDSPATGSRPSTQFEEAAADHGLTTVDKTLGLTHAMDTCTAIDEASDQQTAYTDQQDQMADRLDFAETAGLGDTTTGSQELIIDQQIRIFCPRHEDLIQD